MMGRLDVIIDELDNMKKHKKHRNKASYIKVSPHLASMLHNKHRSVYNWRKGSTHRKENVDGVVSHVPETVKRLKSILGRLRTSEKHHRNNNRHPQSRKNPETVEDIEKQVKFNILAFRHPDLLNKNHTKLPGTEEVLPPKSDTGMYVYMNVHVC